jgi:signal transduction histidine kinase
LPLGDIHQQSNRAPQWYLGTYSLYIRLLLPHLIAEFGHAPERLNAYLSSLHKVMFLAMGLAIDTHISGRYMNRSLGEQFHESADQATAALAARDAEASAKQTLVDMLVHDIRNPVSGIRMTAQLVLRHEEELPVAQTPRVRRIEHAATDVLRMIQNILEISTLEAGMLITEPEDFPVEEIIRQSVEDARPHIDDAQVSVFINTPPTPLHAWADRMLTRRILQNLLANAIRHSRATEIRLTAVPQEDTVVVGVADHGAGIPNEHHKLIFERFRHFDRGTSAHSDTGLGLPFCKLAVEQMGGVIWVDSSHGQGSSFYFTLPRSATKRVES